MVVVRQATCPTEWQVMVRVRAQGGRTGDDAFRCERLRARRKLAATTSRELTNDARP
jgi:hypothetical protein